MSAARKTIPKRSLLAARAKEPGLYPLPLLEKKLASLTKEVERRRAAKKVRKPRKRPAAAKKKAPPRQRALPAPRIAGLLPAHVPAKPARKRTAQPRTWRTLSQAEYDAWENGSGAHEDDDRLERSRTEPSRVSARASRRLQRTGPRRAPAMVQRPLFGGGAAKLTRRQGGFRGRLEEMASIRREKEDDE